jgi:hypothetical protein
VLKLRFAGRCFVGWLVPKLIDVNKMYITKAGVGTPRKTYFIKGL